MRQETWKPSIIIPLESGRPEGEWGYSLQSSRLFLPIGILPLTEGQFIGYCQSRGVQEVALHWIYKKKWNPAHKITDDRKIQKEVKLLEPYSNVLLAWLNLCEALHTLADIGYQSAGHWFTWIAVEMHKEHLKNFLAEGDESIFCPGKARSIAGKLSNGLNPFDPDDESCFHRWIAVQTAINAKQSHPLIYKTFLKGSQRQKPHLGLEAAYSAFETSKEKDGHRSWEIKDGVLMFVSGKGKSRTRLVVNCDLSKENSLEKSVQKTIAEKPT